MCFSASRVKHSAGVTVACPAASCPRKSLTPATSPRLFGALEALPFASRFPPSERHTERARCGQLPAASSLSARAMQVCVCDGGAAGAQLALLRGTPACPDQSGAQWNSRELPEPGRGHWRGGGGSSAGCSGRPRPPTAAQQPCTPGAEAAQTHSLTLTRPVAPLGTFWDTACCTRGHAQRPSFTRARRRVRVRPAAAGCGRLPAAGAGHCLRGSLGCTVVLKFIGGGRDASGAPRVRVCAHNVTCRAHPCWVSFARPPTPGTPP